MTDRVTAFATVDPFDGMNATAPGQAQNLVAGEWVSDTQDNIEIIDPVNGELMLHMPDTQDLAPFVDGMKGCPKSGLHNPFKNVERYVERVSELGCECAVDGRQWIRLVLPPELEVRSLYEIAANDGVQIRHLDYQKDSLQDIFLKAMERG